jgi:hypothetical protein
LLVCTGILTLLAPFYRISKWILLGQFLLAVKIFMIAGKMFSLGEYKLKIVKLLIKRNQAEFRPDTFEIFMQAPCGRLIVRQTLRDLHKPWKYKSLKKLQKPFLERLQNNCRPLKTVIYISKEFIGE